MIYIILFGVAMIASVAHALYDPANRTGRTGPQPEPDWAGMLRRAVPHTPGNKDDDDEDWQL